MADGAVEKLNTEQEDMHVDQASLKRYARENAGSALAISSLDDIKRLSTIFIGSGMFKGDRGLSQTQQLYQAGVKIIAGVEFGIQPFAAMRGINIISGNAEMSANLMAAKVKKHPKYDYRVTKWDDEGCVIKFYELPYPGAKKDEWDDLGDSEFNHEHAVQAQLAGGQNWKKFARNMYFARAMSNGVRIYTPDVFYGAPVYVEGEISGQFIEDNEPEPAVLAEDVSDEDMEIQEGEVVTDESHPEPDTTDEQVWVALEVEPISIVRRLQELGVTTEGKLREFVRLHTSKPFLKNCTADDLQTLADALDRIEAGYEALPWN
jgi:hypothetical protein